MIPQLQERQRQLNDALAICKTAIEDNDATLVPDYTLKLEPDLDEAKATLEQKEQPPKSDPFNNQDTQFKNNNGFSSDPFKSNGFSSSADPFAKKVGFDDSFGGKGGFEDDSFGGNFNQQPAQHSDPFGAPTNDPFGDKKTQSVTPDVSD